MNESAAISQIIQLSVAPVFLIAGIGALLGVVTARLGRAVDRARDLETRLYEGGDSAAEKRFRHELGVLDRRMILAQQSITLCSLSALLVCIVVAALFIGALAGVNLAALIAVLFVLAMAILIGGLAFFLAEILLATKQLRVRAELLLK